MGNGNDLDVIVQNAIYKVEGISREHVSPRSHLILRPTVGILQYPTKYKV
jgi:hypothetical protein